MVNLILGLFLVLFYTPGTHAGTILSLNGFIYLIDPNDDHLLRINTKTDKEDKLPIGRGALDIQISSGFILILNHRMEQVLVLNKDHFKIEHIFKTEKNPQHLCVNRDFFVYVPNHDSNSLSFIEPTFKRIHHFHFGSLNKPFSMCCLDQWGYILNLGDSTVVEINLYNHKVVRIFDVSKFPLSMCLYGSTLYLVSGYERLLTCLNVESRRLITHNLDVGPEPMLISGKTGIIFSRLSQTLTVIDLEGYAPPKVITLGKNPDTVLYEGEFAYIYYPKTSELDVLNISAFDSKGKKTGTIRHVPKLTSMVVRNTFLYGLGDTTLVVYDLNTLKPIHTVMVPINTQPQARFAHHSLYLGNTVLYDERSIGDPFQHILFFDSDFMGIYGDYLGDGNVEFTQALKCLERRHYTAAKEHFNRALCYGDSKANALGALAFLNGLWGAPEDHEWFFEFFKACDLETYKTFHKRMIIKQ